MTVLTDGYGMTVLTDGEGKVFLLFRTCPEREQKEGQSLSAITKNTVS
jgi:hypothetical protein